jgi:hypothetical protein
LTARFRRLVARGKAKPNCNEPMHVHVRRDRQHAKFWLAPVSLAWNHGFSPRELNEIRRLVVENEPVFIEAWHEHCGQR